MPREESTSSCPLALRIRKRQPMQVFPLMVFVISGSEWLRRQASSILPHPKPAKSRPSNPVVRDLGRGSCGRFLLHPSTYPKPLQRDGSPYPATARGRLDFFSSVSY